MMLKVPIKLNKAEFWRPFPSCERNTGRRRTSIKPGKLFKNRIAHQLKTTLSPPQAAGGTAGGSRWRWLLCRGIPVCKQVKFQRRSFRRFSKSLNQSSGPMTVDRATAGTVVEQLCGYIKLLQTCRRSEDQTGFDWITAYVSRQQRVVPASRAQNRHSATATVRGVLRLSSAAQLLAAATLPPSSHRFHNQSSPCQRVCGRLIMPAAAPQQGRNNNGLLAPPCLR